MADKVGCHNDMQILSRERKRSVFWLLIHRNKTGQNFYHGGLLTLLSEES